MHILITGAAGFIGFHLAHRLLHEGHTITVVDDLNGYYDVGLKKARLEILTRLPGFFFQQIDIADQKKILALFDSARFDRVLHLAAQPGVRYSLENPHAYANSNLVGFLNILEACRQHQVAHLVYASSSSVYGTNEKTPFSETDNVDHPASLYAATKKSNELMAHSYSHLFGLPTTGLRFFTVYGPWGRPDMSPFLFAKAICEGRPLKIFNYGKHQRDFTYVDDIVDGVLRAMNHVPQIQSAHKEGQSPGASAIKAPWRIYNIGNDRPIELLQFVELLEKGLGKKAQKELLPMQPGDVESTHADITALRRDTGYDPATPIERGVEKFVAWFKNYYSF